MAGQEKKEITARSRTKKPTINKGDTDEQKQEHKKQKKEHVPCKTAGAGQQVAEQVNI